MSSSIANLTRRAARLDSCATDLTSMDSCAETRHVWRTQRGLRNVTPASHEASNANLAVQAVLIGEHKGGAMSKLSRFSVYAHQYFIKFRKPPMTSRTGSVQKKSGVAIERSIPEAVRSGVEGDRASFPGLVPERYSTLDPTWRLGPCRNKRWRLSTVSVRPAPPPPTPPRAFSLFTTPPLDSAPVIMPAKVFDEPGAEKTLRATFQKICSSIQISVVRLFTKTRSSPAMNEYTR